jgi:hypothetical protein
MSDLSRNATGLAHPELNDPVAHDVGDLVPDPLRFEQKEFRLIRGHAGKKLLEAVADEKRLHFNDELRRLSKLGVVFDLKEAGP